MVLQEALARHAYDLRARLESETSPPSDTLHFQLTVRALLSKALPEEEASHLAVILRHLNDLDGSNRRAAAEVPPGYRRGARVRQPYTDTDALALTHTHT